MLTRILSAVRSLLVVFVLVGAIACRPDAVQPEAVQPEAKVAPKAVTLIKEAATLIKEDAKANLPQLDYKLIGYVRNLMNSMHESLKAQFKLLSKKQMAQGRLILKQFFLRFANDLKQVQVQAKAGMKYRKKQIRDNMKESTFDIVRQRIRSEFPEMGKNTVEELVYRLRKNLMWTRFKINSIIQEAKHLSYVSGDGAFKGPGLALVKKP